MTRTPSDSWAELDALCEALIEDRLTPAERDRLEALVLSSAEAKARYVRYLQVHAGLVWSATDPLALRFSLASKALATPMLTEAPPVASWLRWGGYVGLLTASLALVVGGLWALDVFAPTTLATLTDSHSCKWEAGTLPTLPGSRLGAGRLRLAEGMARIVFDSGAEITLEGPAELETVRRDRCVLHQGRLIAKVPPQALGFVVETPTAHIVDWGTEFGVHVEADRADVQVFAGEIEAQHRSSGEQRRLTTGANLRFSLDAVREFDPLAEQPKTQPRSVPSPGLQFVRISTATGQGKDAYIQPIIPKTNRSDVLLLVKNTTAVSKNYYRKAYIGFDLSSIRGSRVVDAQLILTFAPTDMGFASEVPDATFTVYGLIDESLDHWDEQTIDWNNAPANAPGGAGVDLTRVRKLGNFEIKQGLSSGTRSIEGKELVDFLNADTNGIVTLIVVRDTMGSGKNDLVHGFASKEHPHLAPPTLTLGMHRQP